MATTLTSDSPERGRGALPPKSGKLAKLEGTFGFRKFLFSVSIHKC